MIRFKSLADNNCLYNSLAAWLVYAYQHPRYKKDLISLSKNKQFVEKVGPFLQQLGEKNGKTDWIAVQQTLAKCLRTWITEEISNNPLIKRQVKKQLKAALEQSLEISTAENTNLSDHFTQMEGIATKVTSLAKDLNKTLEQKKKELNAWFFNKKAVGWNEYLQGENGIAKPGVEAGVLECQVFSALTHIPIHFLVAIHRDEEIIHQGEQIIEGFKPVIASPQKPKNKLTFTIEQEGPHWNTLFDDCALSKQINQSYQAQRKQYEEQVRKQENHIILQEKLAKYGSYKAHRCKELKGLHYKEYLKLYGLTASQYRKNISPLDLEHPRPLKAKNRILFLARLKKSLPEKHTWRAYLGVVASFAFTFILASQIIISPFFVPFFAPLFVGSWIATNINIFSGALSLIFGGFLSFLITEKAQALQNKAIKKALINKSKSAVKLCISPPKPLVKSAPQLIFSSSLKGRAKIKPIETTQRCCKSVKTMRHAG